MNSKRYYKAHNKKGYRWTAEEDQLLMQRFSAGMKNEELAYLHGRSKSAVRNRLRLLKKEIKKP